MARTSTYHDWGKTHKQFSYALLGAGRTITQDVKRDFTYVAQELLSEMNAEWPHTSRGRAYFGGKIKVLNGSQFGGDKNHPWYTGQLHDSVAIRIADRNKTVSVSYMPPLATQPQYMNEGGTKISNIIGADWAREVAEAKAPYFFLPGVQVQLIVGVPYAEKVNDGYVGKYGSKVGRHLGFFDELSTELINKYDQFLMEGSSIKTTRYIADGSGRVKKKRGIR